MAYTKTVWEDLPSTNTPITTTRLNNMENGIETNDKKLSGEEVIGDIVVDSIRTKNMFDSNTIVGGDITNAYSTIRLSSRQALWLEAGTYTFSTNLDTSTYNYGVGVQSVGVPPLSSYPTYILDSGWKSTSSYTFTINTAGYFNIVLKKADNSNLTVSDISSFNYQLEEGSTATPYSDYQNLDRTLDNYSTSEQRIGTWIDGKPIYRKVIETTSPSSSDTNTNIYTITENMEDIIDLKGQLNAERPSYKGSINCYITNGDYIATWAMTSNYNPTNIRCRCSSNRTSSPMKIIVEYTKTTD